MKVSLNSIRGMMRRYHCGEDVTAIGVAKLVQKIGAQLGAVEEVINVGEKYEGIVIVKVLESVKHPDADKLHVCKIDADKGEPVQVVCGAPNVREGMLAAWLPPGATVPSSFDEAEPFVVGTREIRGVKSHGMLASPKELALADSHEGLLEIDGDIKPGADFAETFELKDDVVLDIENKMFTHRPDCFGFLGVARELAGIQQKPFKSPAWYATDPKFPGMEAEELKLHVKNELPELVPRFMAIALSDVQVGPSPAWLQVELAKVGQKSINNIVDYTNFFMLETGQPLHAYDYDKVRALSGAEATIVIRHPHKGETIKLLNGKTVEPRAETVMIATDKQAIGIGGVMGGTETEVDENTTNIILECANFDMYAIRHTSMAHGLFTESSTRFTKNQNPLQCPAVSAKVVDEIRRLAGGKVASPLIDDKHDIKPFPPVKVSANFINLRLGEKLTAAEMKKLLENVEFQVEAKGNELTIMPPFWRTDVGIPEDVVEEVGRLYGYDHLPLTLPKRDLTPAPRDLLLETKNAIRAKLAKAGANEVLTYSFVHGDLLAKTGQDKLQAFQISNALSPNLQYYRLSLTPSLLEKVHPNIKAGYDEFALFELGKAHVLGKEEAGLPAEFDRLVLVIANKQKQVGAPYYRARKYLMSLLDSLNLADKVRFEPLDKNKPDSATSYYQSGRAATVHIADQVLGRIGEYRSSVRMALKLPDNCAGFEIGLAPLLSQTARTSYTPLPRFPKVTQDITLKVAADLAYQELADFLEEELNKTKPKNTLLNLSPLDVFQPEKSRHKNATFRLQIASYERTLTDAEVNKLLDAAAAAAKTKFGAERA